MEQVHNIANGQRNNDNAGCNDLILKNICNMRCDLTCGKRGGVLAERIENRSRDPFAQRFCNSFCGRLKCRFQTAFGKLAEIT